MRYTLICLEATGVSIHKLNFGDVGQWNRWVKSFFSTEISLTQKEPLSYWQKELQTRMLLYMWSGSQLNRWTCHIIQYINFIYIMFLHLYEFLKIIMSKHSLSCRNTTFRLFYNLTIAGGKMKKGYIITFICFYHYYPCIITQK